jgi:hypothetical protein
MLPKLSGGSGANRYPRAMDGPMTRDTYQVTISREDPWWVAVVDGVGATEAKRVTDLDEMVRDLIVVMRDLDCPDFNLIWACDLTGCHPQP